MGRPPLPVGTFGKIDFFVVAPKRVRARASLRDFDGRRRPLTRYGASRAEAERRLRTALRDRTGPSVGTPAADSRLSIVATLWLADVDDSELAVGTKRLYRFVVEGYVLPALGELRLREVTVPAVDRMLDSVHDQHGPGAAKSARSVLSGILGMAVRHGALASNPVREVSGRRRPRTAVGPRALTIEESRRLREWLAADPEALRLDLPELVGVMLGTGMRIGETCALRYPAVDFDAATLTVRATVVRVPKQGLHVQDFPKSDAGRRTIALPTYVVDLLVNRRESRQSSWDPELVFQSPLGRLRDPNNTSGDLRRALDRAGFEWVTSHVFRKTVATRLDEARLSAREIADHLGHKRPSLTQDVYMGRGIVGMEAARVLQAAK